MGMQSIGEVINKIVKKRKLGDFEQLKTTMLKNPQIHAFIDAHKTELSQAMIDNSLSNLYEYYVQLTEPDKVMVGYRPELFINGKVIDVCYRPTEEKILSDQQLASRRNLRLLDLPERLRQVKLADLEKSQDRQQALLEIGNFLKNYTQNHHQKGLYLSGDFGVGKTFMLAAVANYLANHGAKVIFLHVPTFVASLGQHINDNTLGAELDRLAKCDILILDDIGAETLSQWSRDDVLGVVLQGRMDNNLTTFFSSNFAMDQLEQHFAETKNASDPVKAARIMQRVRFLAKEIVVGGPNKRNFAN